MRGEDKAGFLRMRSCVVVCVLGFEGGGSREKQKQKGRRTVAGRAALLVSGTKLPVEAEGHLDVTFLVVDAGDCAEGGGGRAQVRTIHDGVIERVEELAAVLEAQAFADAGVLDNRGIDVVGGGQAQ